MHSLVRFIEKITQVFSGIIQGWFILIMMLLVLVDVTSRYVLNDPLSIAEEFGGYLLVTVVCMGLAYAWKERGHVRVEFLIAALPGPLRKWVRLLTLLLAFIFTGFMTVAAWELVETSLMFGTRSGSWLRTPIAYPQIVIILGSAWMFLQLVAEIIKALAILHDPEVEAE
jgi:TRAP-type C4-dicarboxylate transport system permease small subunit